MENKLKVYPVMLPTENQEATFVVFEGGEIVTRIINKEGSYLFGEGWKYQHLYLVSDREIKEGWVISEGSILNHKSPMWIHKDDKKVEATTDRSLGLPLIPERFVKEWVEKQGKIEHVYLQLHQLKPVTLTMDEIRTGLRLTENAEVIILPTKDTFTREDMYQAWLEGTSTEWGPCPSKEILKKTFNEWLDKLDL